MSSRLRVQAAELAIPTMTLEPPRIEGRWSVVLLAGGTSARDFSAGTGRSMLDLPVTGDRPLWKCWQDQLGRLGPRDGSIVGKVRVVGGMPTRWTLGDLDVMVRHIDEPNELRGTGGILRDLTADHEDDDLILFASAATLLLEPLDTLLNELWDGQSDVALFAQEDGTALNLTLVRCGCLRSIPEVGFVDFKEQALPKIAKANSVSVIRREEPVAMSLRTPAEYVRALRMHHRKVLGRDGRVVVSDGPFCEDWQPSFQIIETGSQVGTNVRVHDSVILDGARVGDRAVIVRSVVCPGAVVPRGAVVVDQFVRPAHRSRGAGAAGAGARR